MALHSKTLFITGGSGHIGSVIVEQALSEGYNVRALSRTEDSDRKLEILGGVPIRGDLTSLDVLRRESKTASGVIHLATAYEFGGPPFETVMPIDIAAQEAICDGLAASGKTLVVTSGTLITAADPDGKETTESSPEEPNPINSRGKVIDHAMQQVERGIAVVAVRLAPFTYGHGRSGPARFMAMASNLGFMPSVDGGKNHTTTVHVDDAAALYLLVLAAGKSREAYNASSCTDVTARQMQDAIAKAVGVPVREFAFEEAKATFGEVVARFLAAENRASGDKARRELNWKPTGVGILEDIENGSYQAGAKQLKQKSA